jgi:hypothetical protein
MVDYAEVEPSYTFVLNRHLRTRENCSYASHNKKIHFHVRLAIVVKVIHLCSECLQYHCSALCVLTLNSTPNDITF